jgi:hypothetical protein
MMKMKLITHSETCEQAVKDNVTLMKDNVTLMKDKVTLQKNVEDLKRWNKFLLTSLRNTIKDQNQLTAWVDDCCVNDIPVKQVQMGIARFSVEPHDLDWATRYQRRLDMARNAGDVFSD